MHLEKLDEAVLVKAEKAFGKKPVATVIN